MLSRYSHVRMGGTLDEIAARQCKAGEKRKDDAERQSAAVVSQLVAGGLVMTTVGPQTDPAGVVVRYSWLA